MLRKQSLKFSIFFATDTSNGHTLSRGGSNFSKQSKRDSGWELRGAVFSIEYKTYSNVDQQNALETWFKQTYGVKIPYLLTKIDKLNHKIIETFDRKLGTVFYFIKNNLSVKTSKKKQM